MEYKTLNNGLKMPMVGLGVYNIPEKETQRVVEDALSVGYRSIDTAAMYENEKGVGDAVRACNVPREELFVTTKICESCYTRKETLRTVDQSMRQIGLDYVDLMLLHWPVGNPAVMWHTLEELYAQGLFKAIGVSNFYPNTFPMIVKDTKIMPVVNQCEAHVLYQQRKMREYLKPYDVALEAWSPLAEGRSSIFKDKTLVGIGEKYGKTSAQIALKFLVQNDIIIIPKTTHKERMVENISLFDFTLIDDDLAAIRRLDTGRNVTGWPSDALRYEPASVDWPSAVNYFVLT
jgi:diketogulonate reductase-like aldo/keto reductase